MHFVRAFSMMRTLGVRLIVNEKAQNCGKTVFIKNMFENGWWGDASPMYTPLDPPLPALITMSLTTRLTSRFGFCMMPSKLCHSFEIIARTALAQFGHFDFKGGGRPPKPPWGGHW